MGLVQFTLVVLLVRQMEFGRSPSGAAKVAYSTVAMQAAMDSYFFVRPPRFLCISLDITDTARRSSPSPSASLPVRLPPPSSGPTNAISQTTAPPSPSSSRASSPSSPHSFSACATPPISEPPCLQIPFVRLHHRRRRLRRGRHLVRRRRRGERKRRRRRRCRCLRSRLHRSCLWSLGRRKIRATCLVR